MNRGLSERFRNGSPHMFVTRGGDKGFHPQYLLLCCCWRLPLVCASVSGYACTQLKVTHVDRFVIFMLGRYNARDEVFLDKKLFILSLIHEYFLLFFL